MSDVFLRRLTLAAIVTNVMIVVTGGAVRLTGSGLGCPEWPTCNDGSVAPQASADVTPFHQAIEFGNRLLSFVVLAVAVAVLVAVWRHRRGRSDLLRPAVLLVAGILGQGVVGGITVLTGLHPLIVASHFLLSIVLIGLTVVLHHRAALPGGPTRVRIRPELRWIQHVLVAVVGIVVTLGTLVTASGPHAGDPGTPRLGIDPRVISQFHADGVFLLFGLALALWLALRATDAPAATSRAVAVLLGVSLAQGVVGYVQYFTGLPELLVGVHLLGACLVWIAAVHMWLAATAWVGTDTPTAADPTLAGVAHADR